MANRKETARSFAKTKVVAIGKDKVSDGGHDRYADGKSGWNADVGGRIHPERGSVSEETEYVGPQSTSYNRSTRVGEKVAFDPTSYLIGASAGASMGSAVRGGVASMFGRRIGRLSPVFGGVMAASLVGVGQMAGARKRRRRDKMIQRWARTGVPSYRSRIG